MVKVIGWIALAVVLVIGGYFADSNFRSQVDGMIGKKATKSVATVVNESTETAIAPVISSKGGNTMQKILDTGTVNVSVQNPSKPFYFSNGGRSKGFNVEFMSILFAQSEFKGAVNVMKPVETDTYAGVPKQLLTNKQTDIAIDGLTFNDDDLNGVVYTIPYVKDFGYSLITAKGNNVQNVADTVGMRIGVLQGDPDATAFVESTFPGARIVELSDKVDANGKWIVGHIKSGKVDAVVYDYPFAVAEVADTDLQFAMTKIKGSDIQYRIGVRKEDKELLSALNSAIRKSVDTPEYTEMLKKYFMSESVASVRRASSGEASYIVAKGDTLGSIAQSQLGDSKRYGDIQSRNNLANPNFIAVGQKLVIPASK